MAGAGGWRAAAARVGSGGSGSGGETLTLFDLRKLRFRGIELSSEWERVVYGYDLFVLIPELTPGSAVE